MKFQHSSNISQERSHNWDLFLFQYKLFKNSLTAIFLWFRAPLCILLGNRD